MKWLVAALLTGALSCNWVAFRGGGDGDDDDDDTVGADGDADADSDTDADDDADTDADTDTDADADTDADTDVDADVDADVDTDADADGCPDLDDDHHADEACGGDDCDDDDPQVRPGYPSCTAQNADCDTVRDSCGNSMDCGDCTRPETCGGAGVANQCGCTPDCRGRDCGDDGCGGDCGSCPDERWTCDDGICCIQGGEDCNAYLEGCNCCAGYFCVNWICQADTGC